MSDFLELLAADVADSSGASGMPGAPDSSDSAAPGITATNRVRTVLFECLAVPLARLFGMASQPTSGDAIRSTVVAAVRIASVGYIFMAFSVAVQGVLQAFRYALFPLLISFLRLCLLVLPVAYLFTLSANAADLVWWTFPIVEFVTAIVSAFMLKYAYKKKVCPLQR